MHGALPLSRRQHSQSCTTSPTTPAYSCNANPVGTTPSIAAMRAWRVLDRETDAGVFVSGTGAVRRTRADACSRRWAAHGGVWWSWGHLGLAACDSPSADYLGAGPAIHAAAPVPRGPNGAGCGSAGHRPRNLGRASKPNGLVTEPLQLQSARAPRHPSPRLLPGKAR